MSPIERWKRMRHPHRVRLAPLLSFTALLAAAAASPLPAQDAAETADAWDATAELSFTDASGNRDIRVLTTGLSLEHNPYEVYTLQLDLKARYGSSGSERVIENYSGEINMDLDPSERWSPFLYSTAQHNPPRRVDLRLRSGAGARYRLYRADDRGRAALNLAMLYSHEEFATAEASPAKRTARWSVRLNGVQEIRDDVTISHSTDYQPVFGELDDYLLSLETTLEVVVTNHIALSVSHEFDRNSKPAADDVEPDDRLLKAGILVEL